MKIFSMAIVTLALLVGINAQAASKSEVWDLLQRIDNEIRYYNQDAATLEQVKMDLLNALSALRGGNNPRPSPQSCLDFAYEEYRKDGYSNSTSMEKARKFCQSMSNQNSELQVVQYMYEILRRDGYSVSTSLDSTLTFAKNVDLAGLDCVKSAFPRYRQDGYSGKTSLEKAVGFCRRQ